MNILIIPHSIWTGMPGRFDCFINNLKENNHVHVLSWDMPYPLTFKNLKNIGKSRIKFKKNLENNVTIHHVGRPFIFPPLNCRVVRSQISQIIENHGIDLIFSEAFLGDFLPPFDEVPVIYDMVDDHLAFFKDAPLKNKIMSKISRVERTVMYHMENAEHTVFVSSVLYDKYEDLAKEASIIPNGVYLNKFSAADSSKYVDLLSLDEYEYVLGYVGYFGEWSNLYKITENLMGFLDEYNGALIVAGIGPESEKLKRDFRNNERIIFTGLLDPEEIPSLTKALDIGLLPFKKCPYTDAASPIKYFEYAAAGIKVISSPLEEIKRINFNNTIFMDSIENINVAMDKALDFDFSSSELKRSVKGYDWYSLSEKVKKLFKRYIE